METISNGDGRGWGCTFAGMDGDRDEVPRERLRMELRLAGTVGDGDHCSSPCSSPIRRSDTAGVAQRERKLFHSDHFIFIRYELLKTKHNTAIN
jgi:hypothetical protein